MKNKLAKVAVLLVAVIAFFARSADNAVRQGVKTADSVASSTAKHSQETAKAISRSIDNTDVENAFLDFCELADMANKLRPALSLQGNPSQPQYSSPKIPLFNRVQPDVFYQLNFSVQKLEESFTSLPEELPANLLDSLRVKAGVFSRSKSSIETIIGDNKYISTSLKGEFRVELMLNGVFVGGDSTWALIEDESSSTDYTTCTLFSGSLGHMEKSGERVVALMAYCGSLSGDSTALLYGMPRPTKFGRPLPLQGMFVSGSLPNNEDYARAFTVDFSAETHRKALEAQKRMISNLLTPVVSKKGFAHVGEPIVAFHSVSEVILHAHEERVVISSDGYSGAVGIPAWR
ncbi:hypothetical protein [Gimesia maris]|uniref:hypothetical protein n=1 Tax=Gimesia maris TaxID=122 RepID=UPI003A8E3319